MKPTQTILWRRLDSPGHDACALWQMADCWRLSGTAIFMQDTKPCHLNYQVECNGEWQTRSGKVMGWLDHDFIKFEITASSDRAWSLNGSAVPGVEGCTDLDLGFTPATNLLLIRRVALEIGQRAGSEATAAYLYFPELALQPLEQSYHRVSANRYDYASPAFEYAETLDVASNGFVTHYPHLWTAEEAATL